MKLRSAINECWRIVYHNLGRNKDRLLDDDKFLRTHYLVHFPAESDDAKRKRSRARVQGYEEPEYADSLLRRIFVQSNLQSDAAEKDRLTLPRVYEYVTSLQDSAEMWYNIFNPFDSSLSDDAKIWLDKLNRINMTLLLPLFLVVLLKVRNDRKRVDFLRSAERHLFIVSLYERYGIIYVNGIAISRNDPRLLNIARQLNNGTLSSDSVTKSLTDMTSHILKAEAALAGVLGQIRTNGFYGWPLIRYFLYEYNLHLQTRSRTDRAKINWAEFSERRPDFLTIEHIYPQNARHAYWTTHFGHLNQKQRDAVRNSLGNLLPLSQPKNSALSNKPFPEKRDGVAGQDCVAYRYGSYAENEVSVLKDWTPDAILLRGLRMLDFLEKRWEISLGSETDKISLLGLTFLKKMAKQ